MKKEEYFKLHKDGLYGKSVYIIIGERVKSNPKAITDYIHENYCYNHDVATGNYDCPYADVVNNSIMCTTKSCWYQYNKYADPLNKSMVVNNTDTNSNYELSLDDSDIVDYPF